MLAFIAFYFNILPILSAYRSLTKKTTTKKRSANAVPKVLIIFDDIDIRREIPRLSQDITLIIGIIEIIGGKKSEA